ncbi:uncharacterized protein C8A04DRAFT_25151 [Dichotomopilus funicola]|uniref:SnoaL-like domain-containing protein n=1 Tax=Dichotomopilus funicola TaxID=1934379 RepID=A0AAN6V8V4_9PEZI|nr:hypothetical protein C8A04DRAFT_25151 [Dichotomopilus funicola]
MNGDGAPPLMDGAPPLNGLPEHEVLYPTDITVDPSIRAFISRFYHVSDDPDRNGEWADFFTEDALVKIGSNVAEGTEEIHRLRENMWVNVATRKHRVAKVFPAHFPATPTAPASIDDPEFMLFGTVAYTPRNSSAYIVVDWAGHARLTRDGADAPWRMLAYTVYF